MGHKILIIDDDEDIADNIRILLTYEGFEVITADNIEDGFRIIEEENPELLLLDLMFPESKFSGIEAALEIKKRRSNLPIFAFTAVNKAYAHEFHKEDIPVEEFMVKPVNSKILAEKIKRYLG